MEWTPLFLSLKLACCTAGLLLLIGIPLAYALVFGQWRGKVLVRTFITLPIVLPSTVLGFYFLTLASPTHVWGDFFANGLKLDLIFSFEGLVLGSVIYALPFMVQPIEQAFEQIPAERIQFITLLGKNRRTILQKVILPASWTGIISGIVLSFAHTLGEFGLVLMVGGNIPGETKVASIALYEAVELGQQELANKYALILLGTSFLVLVLVQSLRKGHQNIRLW